MHPVDIPPISPAIQELKEKAEQRAETVTLTASVKNDGMVDAGNVVVSFFQGDPETGGTPVGAPQTIPGLPAGETASVSMEFETAGSGGEILPLYAQVDPEDAIVESDEEDNARNRSLYVRRSTPLAGVDMDWTSEGTIWGASRLERLSVVLDSQDTPRVAVVGVARGKAVRYGRKTQSGWSYTDLVDGNVIKLTWPSLAMGSDDRPHIAYCYDGSINQLRYAHFDGAQWDIQTVEAGAYPFKGGQTSIQIDGSDRPHIAYYGRGDLRYAFFDGVEWQIEWVAGTGTCVAPQLALDSQGRPHILYQTTGSPGYYFYAHRDEAGWHTQRIDERGSTSSRGDIILDAADRPHIAYWNETELLYKYGYLDGDQWHLEAIESQVLSGYTKDASIRITSQGMPVVVYAHDTGFQGPAAKLHFAARLSGGWDVQEVLAQPLPGYSPLYVSYADLDLTPDDRPVICFDQHFAIYTASREWRVSVRGARVWGWP